MSTSATKIRFNRRIARAAEISPFTWAVSYIALPKSGTWSFDDMKWQIEIMEDKHPSIIVMKATQIGLTTISTIKALWFISYIKSRAMYTLPRKDDVTDYVAATVDPMIENSEFLSARVGKTNTQRLKRIGDSYFHVMEASVTPRMLPVDILVNDEVDLSDQDNLEQFIARLDRSSYKYHYRFSTPTVSGYGIDSDFARSDMREWVVTCSKCNSEQILDWEVNLAKSSDGAYYICSGCRDRLRTEDIVNGMWVAQNSGSSIHGYHVSHMMLPITRPPGDLVAESEVMDRRSFYNLRLGRPWVPSGGSMPYHAFRDNCFSSGHQMTAHRESGYKYFIGADQGNDLHIIVGRVPDGSDSIEIVYAEHVKSEARTNQFDRLGAIIRMFDIDFGICDANPNRVSSYSVASEFHGSMAAADIGSYNYPFRWHGFEGDSAYKITCNRSDILDGLRDDIVSGKINFWGTWDTRDIIVREIIKHCSNLKRDIAKRKLQSGGEKIVSIWRKTGEDHYAFALALLRLAVIISPNKSTFSFAVIGDNDDKNDDMELKRSKVWGGLEYYVERRDRPLGIA